MANFNFAYPDIPFIDNREMYDYLFMIDRTLREMGKAINTLSQIDPESIAKLVMPKADGVSIRAVDNVWSVIRAPYASTSGEADKLSTARTITLKGDTTGSVSFDGSADAELPTTTNVATKLRNTRSIALRGDVVGSTTFDGTTNVFIDTQVSHADTADKFTTARNIILTGDTTGSASFDGSADVSIATTTTHSKTADTASKATNADSATKAQVADKLSVERRIELSGDATGSAMFDGSKNIDIATTVVGGTGGGGSSTPYTLTLTGDTTGSATIDGSDVSITTTTVHANVAETASKATLADAAGTATKLATARKIELSGGTEGSAYFDGSKDINIVTTGSSGGDGPVTEPCEPGLQPPPAEVPEEYEDMPLDMSHRYEIPLTGDSSYKLRYIPPEDGMVQIHWKNNYSATRVVLDIHSGTGSADYTNPAISSYNNVAGGIQVFVQGGVELGVVSNTAPFAAYFYAWKRKPTTDV